MIKTQLTTDKLAMSLSTICVLHCFLTPSFLILTSGIFAFTIDNEFVHGLILFLAVPISLLALLMGYKNHQTSAFFAIGCLGLLVLLVTFLLGEETLGVIFERLLTLSGSSLLIFAHYNNHQTCKQLDCDCHEG